MNTLASWLSDGGIRSDGFAPEAAAFILGNPKFAADLVAALDHSDRVIRAHASDALEKVARVRPDLLLSFFDPIKEAAGREEPPAVRLHLGMICGHLAVFPGLRPQLMDALLQLLAKPGAFSRSWAITSLCIIGRLEPELRPGILATIGELGNDDSTAVRTRVRKAIPLLTDSSMPFPAGWVKCERLHFLESGSPGEPFADLE
jgi:HEAT repeat protein